jgi:ABC-2 type transport system permease protein
MSNVYSAEMLKLRRHRATWLLVWIFPIGATLIPIVAILSQLLGGAAPAAGTPDLERWLEQSAAFWNAPPNGSVRFLICGFIGVVFAGEYGWNTWKLIVPHRSRASLLVAKYAVATGLLYLAFILAAAILSGMTWLEDVTTGDPIPAGVTIGGILAAHAKGFVAGLPTVLFTITLVSFLAVMIRSMAGAIIVGIVVVTLEQMFQGFAQLLSATFGSAVELLYNVLPGYHLANFGSWMMDGEGIETAFFSGNVVAYDMTTSLVIALAWTALFAALAFWRFGRQDIN